MSTGNMPVYPDRISVRLILIRPNSERNPIAMEPTAVRETCLPFGDLLRKVRGAGL